MTRTARLLPLTMLLVVACGGESSAPTISGLMVGTSSVARGAPVQGSVQVSDADGLGALQLELALDGPTPVTVAVDVGGASDAATAATVPFAFALSAAAQPGAYTLSVVAIDGDLLRSNALTAPLSVR